MVRSLKLSKTISGEGSPLIILHGLFGASRNWQSVARKLSDQYQVITVDLRNHGNSPHSATMSYPEMADDILQLMDDLKLPSATVIGHSMGGKIAMSLALEHPERCDALCVVDIAPVTYQHDFENIFQAMRSLPVETIKQRREADQWLSHLIDLPVLRAFLLQNLVAAEQGFHWRINLKAIEQALPLIAAFPFSTEDSTYRQPTQFIGGGLSRHLLPKHEALIDKFFPKARIDRIADADHWPHTEQPALFLDLLTEFLDANPN